MKARELMPLLVVAALAAGMAGCGKKSESGTSTATNASASAVGDALKDAANTAATEVKKVAEEVKATAEKAATEASKQAENLTASTTAKAQEYIDKAKAFVNDKKYQDALAALKQLGNVTLSPEQQKAVDDLKKAIQNALGTGITTNGASTINSLLNK